MKQLAGAKSRRMLCACGWKPPFRMGKVAASSWKPVGSKSVRVWNACCWRCLWPSGGPAIWRPLVSIMDSARALIAPIDATRVSFDWADSGCWISCNAHAIERPCSVACRFRKLPKVGALLSASKRPSQADAQHLLRCLGKSVRERDVILPAFDPASVLDKLEQEHISIFFGVPTMLQFLLRQPDF